MRYKIIWIDDEFEKQDAFLDLAFVENIDLVPFKTSKDGMNELNSHPLIYSGVILDAKVFDQSEDEVAETSGLMNSIFNLKEIHKYLPFCVFTGQGDLLGDDNFKKMLPGIRIYKKGIDNERMLKEIIAEADNLPETKIRKDNKNLFSIFADDFLDKNVEAQVLELIKKELPNSKSDMKAFLTNIRSIHESCFLKLEEIGVIPNSETSINNILRHLSGNKTKLSGYLPTTKVYQNEAIENLNEWLYFTCGTYIHNLKDEKYKDYMISNYAVESLRNGLFEFLLWFKQTCELHS